MRLTLPSRAGFLLACATACALLSVGQTELAYANVPGRAYELVSPRDKNGGDVSAESTRIRAAASGNAVTFPSLSGFAGVRGTGADTEYMSVRSTSTKPGTPGWETHPVTPPQDTMSLIAATQGLTPSWQDTFSPDLSHGLFRAWTPVTEDPRVAAVSNLYVRSDLTRAGGGTYNLVTPCPGCVSPLSFRPFPNPVELPLPAATSADFSRILFESRFRLTADAPATPGTPKLYWWKQGALEWVGQIPAGTDVECGGGGPACVLAPRSMAGQSAGGAGGGIALRHTPRTMSEDGTRVFFTVGDTNAATAGRMYLRDDKGTAAPGDDVTTLINASERTVPDAPAPARYWNASVDGTKAFFTTAERLTDDDNNFVSDLYAFDASAPVGSRLTRISVDGEPADAAGDADGVIGTSRDGDYVYFIAVGQLVAGERQLTDRHGIYLWHDGVVSYVGESTLFATDAGANLPGAENWVLVQLRSRVTPDGRHLLFWAASGRGLLSEYGRVDYDQEHCGPSGTGFCQQFYVYEADRDRLQCASCKSSGTPATAQANTVVRVGTGAGAITAHMNRSMTDDGRLVFFTTAEKLVPSDANGISDVYQFDVQSGQASLVSTGTSPHQAWFAEASADGRDVFIVTRERLVGWDVDDNLDVYDARLGGGFPEPPARAPVCAGEACQGPGEVAPPSGAPATATVQGAGNLDESIRARRARRARRCRRGRVQRRVNRRARCVRRAARARRGSRRATSQRRSK